MVSRGEVGLIVATAVVEAGLIGDEIYTSIVLMVLATTLVSPILLRALYKAKGKPEAAAARAGATEEEE
jgi:Kef-type K+ transport system membrane component KefB